MPTLKALLYLLFYRFVSLLFFSFFLTYQCSISQNQIEKTFCPFIISMESPSEKPGFALYKRLKNKNKS